MVQEVRRISLTADELLSAVESYRRMFQGFLPAGKIVRCTPSDDGVLTIALAVLCEGGPQQTTFDFKASALLKPVIRFCIENNIILPRDGNKSLSVTKDGVTLQILLDLNIEVIDYSAALRIESV